MKIMQLLQEHLKCPICGKSRLAKAVAWKGHGTGQHGQAHFNAQMETLNADTHCTCQLAANYIDDQGREALIDTGISGQFDASKVTFAAYRRKPNGNLQRIKSPNLPIRQTQAEAQADLDAYAAKHHWTTK